MATRFFKKTMPSTQVVLGNNSRIQFKTVNGSVGYFSTNDSFVCSEFERFMREGRYNISEIAYPEFEAEYIKKKTSQPVRIYREELGSGAVLKKPSEVSSVAPVAAVEPATVVEESAPVPVAAEHRPVVGRRTKKAVAA